MGRSRIKGAAQVSVNSPETKRLACGTILSTPRAIFKNRPGLKGLAVFLRIKSASN